ncbi:SymE family type I addiction module toxin [Blautia sp.]|uniref:SymE family type I addiction module toxin n=1 Tax=Blautia sp. TaxID=1955243 RepID=UPI0025880E0D|nr:SymE family type I addiction module toxin [Blautia sp.]
MGNRNLTVYSGTTAAYNVIPKIILQGNWLGELGFSIGDKVTVSCQPDKLIIERIAGEQEQQTQETEPADGRRRRKAGTNGRH